MAHSLYETSLQDHGSYILENKYPVQDPEYNYHDSIPASKSCGGNWPYSICKSDFSYLFQKFS